MNQTTSTIQDVLHELGNIGIGSAATSLSALINRPIQTTTSQVHWINDFYHQNSETGYEQCIGIMFPFEHELEGFALFLFNKQKDPYDILLDHWRAIIEQKYPEEEMDEVLKEICGIMISSYLSSIAEYTNLHLCIKLPAVSIDMEGAILNEAFSFLLQKSQSPMYIEHELCMDGESRIQMIMMFHKASVNNILHQLGVNP